MPRLPPRQGGPWRSAAYWEACCQVGGWDGACVVRLVSRPASCQRACKAQHTPVLLTLLSPRGCRVSTCFHPLFTLDLPAESLLHILESYGPDQFAAALVGDSGELRAGLQSCFAFPARLLHGTLHRCVNPTCLGT